MPSRMTIGMLMECLVAKKAACEGVIQNGTPFESPSIEKIGDALSKYGFNRYGKHLFYDGITGKPMEAAIFFAPDYYQRLRHMAEKKIHARSTGPVSILTNQPVEGRARKGGLRWGRMELDCLFSYGAGFTVEERMFQHSDPYQVPVCEICGLFAIPAKPEDNGRASKRGKSNHGQVIAGNNRPYCKGCDSHDSVHMVQIPYSTKLLFQELMAIGLMPRLRLQVSGRFNQESNQYEKQYRVNGPQNIVF
jgi:DNA-directed RNA polymerase II subunit RPB2